MASKKLVPSLKTPPTNTTPELRSFLQDVKTVLDNVGDLANKNVATKEDVQQAIKTVKVDTSNAVQGPPGPPGPPGQPGQATYFHVAYADSADGSVNFNQTSGKYIGTYVDYVQQDSANYTDYTWHKFEGTDGIPGTNGQNGQTSYLHLKYSDDGVTFTPDTGNGIGETPGAWLGQYVDFVQADSTVFSDYTWAKIKGADGVSSYLHIAYAASADGTVGFSTTTINDYIGIYTDTNQADSTNPADYTWSKFVATDGIPGANGYIHIKYSNDGLTFTPDTGNGIGEDPGEWMGQYTDHTLADSTVFSDYKWAKVKGDQGLPSYMHIAYADSADGTLNFSTTTPGKYIGTYTDAVQAGSNNPADYTWALIKGQDGIGIDGTSSYLHLKYSNDGATFTPDTGNGIGEDPGDWLGQYVDSNPTDSTVFADYKWKLIKGSQGPQGPQGTAGLPTYFFTAYADDGIGTNFSLTYNNQPYMGTYSSQNATQSTNPADYTWVRIKGTDGAGLQLNSVTPGVVTGLTGVASRTFVILSWDGIPASYDPQYTIIYRNQSNNFATATIVGTSKTSVYQDYTPSDGTYYYWAAIQSKGSVNQPNGITGPESTTPIQITVFSKITGSNVANYIDANAIDYGSYVGGTKPPANATHGADWGTNLSGKPNDSYLFNNLLDTTSWQVGTSGSQGQFTASQTNASENNIILDAGPDGTTQAIWEATAFEGDGLNADGGWNATVNIDNKKSYRFAVWMKQQSTAGEKYFGCGGGNTLNLDGSTNGNPYFWAGDLPTNNKWYLLIGIVHGADYTGGYSGISGLYDPQNGNKLVSFTEFKNAPTATQQTHRTYLFYDAVAGDKAWFARPRLEMIDGSEPTLESLMGYATYGADLNTNVTGQIDSTNVFNLIAANAIGAEFIGVANLAAINADMGTITAGLMKNVDGTFNIDLINKFIEISGPAGSASDDYIRIENGKIQQYEWTGTAHQLAQSLNTIETGTANNGDTITLQKYYPTQPSIIVTPYDTPIYDSTYSSQSQSIQIRAENVTYNSGIGKWQFDATARLVVSSGVTTVSVNNTIGPSASTPLNSPVYTTQPSTTSVNINVKLNSSRGTGTSGSYYYRNATCTIYYRTSPSGSWVSVSGGVTDIGATLNDVTATYSLTFPNAGTWDFYVSIAYNDSGGTFTISGPTYEYTSETVTQNTPSAIAESANQATGTNKYAYASVQLPAYTTDATWTVTNVDYTINYSYYLTVGGSYATAYSRIYAGHIPSTSGVNALQKLDLSWHPTYSSYNDGDSSLSTQYTTTNSQSSFNQNVELTAKTYAENTVNGGSTSDSKVKILSATAVISFKRTVSNSTIPSNKLLVSNYTLTLSGSTQLSAGTLQWQAIL